MVSDGLRDRKKAQTRRRIADAAAELFAARGYDAVSMMEVARRSEVSEQTVYNYFPAKQDLVLDRADEIRDQYRCAITERGILSPATVLEPLLSADIDRYRQADLDEGRGSFVVQCVESAVVRRFALEEREKQARVIADAISLTAPALPGIVVHTHAWALVAAIQAVHDDIGMRVLRRMAPGVAADQVEATARIAFDSLDSTFTHLATFH